MAKYMIQGSYTTEGTKGLIKEGAIARRATVGKLMEGIGGKIESMYFAFGGADVFVICDVPDAVTAASLSLAVNASGALRLTTIPLLSVEEMDAACKKSVGYRAPGS